MTQESPADPSGADRHPVPVGADAPIFEIMKSMRAMRRLRTDPVPTEMLDQLIEAASWAPSASDLQRYSFVVVTDREQMARIAPIWQAVERLYLATFAEVSRPEYEPGLFARTLAAADYQAEHFADTPALIVACYEFKAFSGAVRRKMMRTPGAMRGFGGRRSMSMLRTAGSFADRSEAASIYPAVHNILLAARSLGLAANMATWHLMAEGELKKILGIPKHVHTYALIPVGWPQGKFGPVSRRPFQEMIHRDRW